ncbi:MAG TPA: SBBP repeat-containing protein [Bryobacteraceae bacterium]|nr:SBBP repeat-containing protein [Bryobacteraceae bacterium]
MKSVRDRLRPGSICPMGGMSRLAALALVAAVSAWAAVPGPGTIFSTILNGSGQDFALAAASDAAGNTYVAGLTYSPDFAVSPGAAQTKFGQTCDVWVAKLAPDGRRIWSTYLGGILDDWATSVAVDGVGNVWVTGYTRSPDFPIVKPVQPIYNNAATDDYDAFVAKISADGSTLLYSTYLGSDLDDGGNGIALDRAGNAYVAITGTTTRFPAAAAFAPGQAGILITKLDPDGALLWTSFHAGGSAAGITLDAAGAIYVTGSASPNDATKPARMFGPQGTGYAILFKLSPDGSRKIFETGLGGSAAATASGIAVSPAGEVFVAGTTTSVDFPLMKPLQTSPGARPLWKSTDGGATWTPFDDLPFAIPQAMAVDPSSPQTLYLSSDDLGLFKSLDAGAHWVPAHGGIAETKLSVLTIDASHPRTLYTAAGMKVYKSTDGAGSWSLIDTAPSNVTQIIVDPQNSNVVYEAARDLRRSTDGGATWMKLAFPGTVQSLALDPHVNGLLYATSTPVFCGFFCSGNQVGYLYRSIDGGATWIQIQPDASPSQSLDFTVDASTNPSTVYLGMSIRTTDGGVTWTPVNPPFSSTGVYLVSIDPGGTLYVPFPGAGIYVSHDRGATWTLTGTPTPQSPNGGPGINVLLASGSSGTLLAELNQVATAGFVSKLSADGATLEFSTYLRAHASVEGFPLFAAEPAAMTGQSWISGVALDPAGNIVVAGGVRGADLPVMNPAQPHSGMADAFAAKIAPDTGALLYSTYFGGTLDDAALAVAVDAQGNIIAAGQTWSADFPLSGSVPQPTGYSEAFIVKLAASTPAITAVVNGASFQLGIAPGAWVTIRGTNLSNTTRPWTSSDIVSGNLPASLDGVSVTIGGRPAFVEYVSPSQINVQAPSDVAPGAVDVFVTNNGRVSAPAQAQMQSVAPAFFLDGATNFAAASRLPDYAPLADPSAVPGAVPAKSGDLVVLWGTGFASAGVPAGVVVQSPSEPASMPRVTVGGAEVPVVGAGVVAGLAGVFQITIQLPADVATGAVNVQASIAGASTPAAILWIQK